jgi:hypothetical protein
VFPLLSFWQFFGRVVSIRIPAHFDSNRRPWRFDPLVFTSLGKLERGQKQIKRVKEKADRLSRFIKLQQI